MKKNNQCPVCNSPLELITIVKAPLPSRIRCPKCKSRLRTVGPTWPLTTVAVLCGMFLVGPLSGAIFAFTIEPLGPVLALVLTLLVFALTVILSDIPLSMHVFRKRTFEAHPKESQQDAAHIFQKPRAVSENEER